MRSRARPLIALLAVLAACATVPRDEAPGLDDADAATVYVVRRGWHTDIGFAVRDLDGPLAAVAGNFPGADYLIVGFGDRGYLEARERGAADLLALWPGEGLMLATGIKAPPQQAFGADEVVELRLRRKAMAAVRGFVQGSFRLPAAIQRSPRAICGQPVLRLKPALQRHAYLQHLDGTGAARRERAGAGRRCDIRLAAMVAVALSGPGVWRARPVAVSGRAAGCRPSRSRCCLAARRWCCWRGAAGCC
jgi:hypothetical protein